MRIAGGAGGDYRNIILTRVAWKGLSQEDCAAGANFTQDEAAFDSSPQPRSLLFWSDKNVIHLLTGEPGANATQFSNANCSGENALNYKSSSYDPMLYDPVRDPRPRVKSSAFTAFDSTSGDFFESAEYLGAFSNDDNWLRGLSFLDTDENILHTSFFSCPQGYGSFTDIESADSCLRCPMHTYDHPHSNYCEMCETGKYAFSTSSSACLQTVDFEYYCEIGQMDYYYETVDTIGNDAGGTNCKRCGSGHFVNWNKRCVECPEGTYSGGGLERCLPCSDGFHSNAARDSCEKCEPGQSWNGTFYDYTDVNVTGSVLNIGSKAGSCVTCAAGKFNAEGKHGGCTSCTEAGSWSPEGASICLQAPAGYYPTDDRSFYKHCPRNFYSEGGLDECLPCSNDLLSAGGAAQCDFYCQPGYILNGTAGFGGTGTGCDACPVGKYAPYGQSTCTNCTDGYEAPNNGTAVCEICLEGKYLSYGNDGMNSSNSFTCLDCPPGTFSPRGAAEGTPCEAGKYSSSPGTVSCTSCFGTDPDNDFKYERSDIGSTTCECMQGFVLDGAGTCVCPAGEELLGKGESAICEKCEEGFYKELLGNFDCSSCLSVLGGSTTLVAGTTSPYDCNCTRTLNQITVRGEGGIAGDPTDDYCWCGDGFVNRTTGSAYSVVECELDTSVVCPAGAYRNKGGVCVNCEPGKFNKDEGMRGEASCVDCLSGQYAHASKATICQDCPMGYFSSGGAAWCDICNTGYFNVARNTTQWNDHTYFENNGHFRGVECETCETQCTIDDKPQPCLNCQGHGTLVRNVSIEEGWWRSHDWSYKFLQCPVNEACSNGTCALGYSGPVCMTCAEGYSKDPMGSCSLCDDGKTKLFGMPLSGAAITLLMGGAFALILLILYKPLKMIYNYVYNEILRMTGARDMTDLILRSTRVQTKGEESSKSNWIQSLKTKGKIIASFYQIVTQFSVNLDVPFPKIFEDFTSKISALFNLEIFSLMKVGCLMGNSYYKSLLFTTLMPITASIGIFIIANVYGFKAYRAKAHEQDKEQVDHERHRRERKQAYAQVMSSGVAVFLTFTYLIFASTSSSIFRTFQCRTYGDDPKRYLVADKNIDCDSDLHKVRSNEERSDELRRCIFGEINVQH